MRVITGDIETSDGLDGCEFALGIFYDGEKFTEFKDYPSLVKYILASGRHTKYYFHNLSFDGRFIQQYLLENGVKFTVSYRNNSILKLLIHAKSEKTGTQKNISVIDSFALIPLALEKFPTVFHLEEKKLSLDDLEARCKSDTVILYKGLQKFLESFPISKRCYTLSQVALKTFNSENHINYRFTSDGLRVDKEKEAMGRFGYFGGRSEIFNMGYFPKVYYYDINSLYPYVMREGLYPIAIKEVSPNKSVLREELYYINATVDVPYSFIPALPVKVNRKLFFTYGKVEGWFYSPEFNLIKDFAENIEIHKAYVFTPARLFKSFIDKYYAMRLKLKREGNNLEYVVKILMNSLYGKFAQRRDKESIVYSKELTKGCYEIAEGIYYYLIEHYNTSANINPFISAFVTSFARAENYRYLNENTVYTDTDSNVSTIKSGNVGEGLGQLKLEYEGEFKAFCPKTYWLKTKDKVIGKAKGVIKSQIPDSDTFEEFEAKVKNTEWRIYAKPKESIKRFHTFLAVKDVKKELSMNYDKRRILDDLSTDPFSYQELMAIAQE